ncbi:unnamed protein product [Blepharisma stoltei]|uniref:VWFA domain-containing protein n=1 Tax=Blepharisma stoltei TaxID=1481888 RepID=A0AAU9J9H6_9CILI|nr:unnamed protein product [Blepharisma stoltei]
MRSAAHKVFAKKKPQPQESAPAQPFEAQHQINQQYLMNVPQQSQQMYNVPYGNAYPMQPPQFNNVPFSAPQKKAPAFFQPSQAANQPNYAPSFGSPSPQRLMNLPPPPPPPMPHMMNAPQSNVSDDMLFSFSKPKEVPAQPANVGALQPESLSPGFGFNASLKGKKVKLVKSSPSEEVKIGEVKPAPVKINPFNPPKIIPMPPPLPLPQKDQKPIPIQNIIPPPPPAFIQLPRIPQVMPPMIPQPMFSAPPRFPPFPGIPQQPPDLDANVTEICMDELAKQNAFATGDPVFCEGCHAVFNFFSKLTPIPDKEEQKWTCEFCNFDNIVHLEPEEIPTQSKLNYLVESSQQVAAQLQGPDDNSTIIFCIDISGSMCVTQPVSGNILLKTNKLKDLQNQFRMDIEGPQYMPSEQRNITYVSRLECLQAAIDSQLTEMQRGTPNRHVGVVTFNNEVTIIGDGSQTVAITGDRLNNFDGLLNLVERKHNEYLGHTINETKEQLSGKVLGLEEGGATALGPALLVSVGLASQGGPGSKVIICTDGIANVGIGSFENLQDLSQANSYYNRVSTIAKEKGVSVSVISIASEDCRLASLAEVVEETGGELTKVDPEDVSADFANILAQQILATNVVVTVNLHKALSFKNQDPALIQPGGTRLIKKFGNVTEDTMFTFEYNVNNTENLEKVPFQVTIEHRKMNGMKCVLVDTQIFEVSDDQEEIMQNANFEVLARNCKLQSASLARQGEYGQAVQNINNWNQYMFSNQRNMEQMAQINEMNEDIIPSYQVMLAEQHNPAPGKSLQSDKATIASHQLNKKKMTKPQKKN